MKYAPLRRKKLIVQASAIHGYGVFAAEEIAAGEIIEECYALKKPKPIFAEDPWADYVFGTPKKVLLPLGFGPIYNHANEPNATYKIAVTKSLVTFSALKPIKVGEEIYISYGPNWFSFRGWNVNCQQQVKYWLQIRTLLLLIMRFLLVCGLFIFVIYYFNV